MGNMLSLELVNAFLISLTFLGFGLLIGFSNGSQIGSSAEETLEAYPLDLSNAGIYRYEQVNADENTPSVDLQAYEDEMLQTDYNLELITENFTFSPENASQKHVKNAGHAHIYVDDVLISRSYGKWYHLPRLEPGNHTIKVTLNTNDHREYSSDRGVVQDEVYVRVPKN